MAVTKPLPLSSTSHPCESGEKLSELGGLQEHFWLAEHTGSHLAILVAEVEGSTTVNDWRDSLASLQVKYPALAARLRKHPGERPYLESFPEVVIDFEVFSYEVHPDLDSILSDRIFPSFEFGDGGLARIALYHGPARSIVVMAAHHAASDGRTLVMMMRDLVAGASGNDIGLPLRALPPLTELLGMPSPEPYTNLLTLEETALRSEPERPAVKVTHHKLGADEFSVLLSRCKAESTTVQGALVAAFILAGRELSEFWRSRPVVCLSPIDYRSLLGVEGSAGVPIGVHPTVSTPEETKKGIRFWDLARATKSDMLKSQTKEGAVAGVEYAARFVLREGNPYDVRTVDPEHLLHHDLMVSNYGNYGQDMQFGSLMVRALYPAVTFPMKETQSISLLTLDGVLHITHSSRMRLTGLWDHARELLIAASTETVSK